MSLVHNLIANGGCRRRCVRLALLLWRGRYGGDRGVGGPGALSGGVRDRSTRCRGNFAAQLNYSYPRFQIVQLVPHRSSCASGIIERLGSIYFRGRSLLRQVSLYRVLIVP
jgi:hypothetical protein